MKRALFALILAGIFVIPAISYAGDPILAFTFDNISGDAVGDLSGNGNDGVLEDGPTVIDGKFGKALQFADSRVKVLASASLDSELYADGMFTVVLWINATRSGNTWQQVFRAGPDPNDTLFLNNDGRLSWRGWVGAAWGGGLCETDPGVVAADTWVHAAVVSDASNFRVYVDGSLSQESAFQATRGNNQELVIGGYAGGESYSGAVDEFAIFGEPLADDMINTIMSAGLQASLTAVRAIDGVAATWGALKR